jgi:CheY-like chemotaxis protein
MEGSMTDRAKRILIVDDDPDTVTYLCTWLEDHGYETYSASCGETGLEAILQHEPHMVLMDLKMPNRTGVQLYKEICSRDTLAGLPVVIITGMAEFRLYGEGCVPLPEPAARLDKPPDLETLQQVIRQKLDN